MLTTVLLLKMACAVVGDSGVLVLLGPLGPLIGLPPWASSIKLVTCGQPANGISGAWEALGCDKLGGRVALVILSCTLAAH